MAKGKKTTSAPPKRTPSTPPPAKGPPGGVLAWKQYGSDTWLAPDPGGDTSRAGARITMRSQRWLGKAEPVYFVYRDSDYLGTDSTFEAAERRAQYREKSSKNLQDTVDGETPAFLKLTKEERDKSRGEYRPTPPKSFAAPTSAISQMPVQPSKRDLRDQMQDDRLAAKAARKAERKVKSSLDEEGIIKMLVDKNPRKPGTGAYARFDMLMKFAGKTVAEYLAAKGNPETLQNAVSDRRAAIDTAE